MAQRPTSVTRATQLIWLLVALALAATVLAVVFDSDLVAAWAGGQGLSVDDQRVPPSFTPVVIVLFVVLASLILVLMSFLRGGHNWARYCLAALVLFVVVATFGGIRTGPPTVFVVFSIVTLVIDVLILVCLVHPATNTYVSRPVRRLSRGA